MSQRGQSSFRGRWLLALAGAAWLFALTGTTRAAGCHVPERPILARGLSWDLWPGTEGGQHSPTPAPQSVRRLPCEGETPGPNPPASPLSPPASLERRAIDPAPLAESLATSTPPGRPVPVAPRLDRPPRSLRPTA